MNAHILYSKASWVRDRACKLIVHAHTHTYTLFPKKQQLSAIRAVESWNILSVRELSQ